MKLKTIALFALAAIGYLLPPVWGVALVIYLFWPKLPVPACRHDDEESVGLDDGIKYLGASEAGFWRRLSRPPTGKRLFSRWANTCVAWMRCAKRRSECGRATARYPQRRVG